MQKPITWIALAALFGPIGVLCCVGLWPTLFSGYESAIQALLISLCFALPAALYFLVRGLLALIRFLRSMRKMDQKHLEAPHPSPLIRFPE